MRKNIKKIILLSLALIIIFSSFSGINQAYAQTEKKEPSCLDQCKGLKQIDSKGERTIEGESYDCCKNACLKNSTDFGLCVGIDNPLGEKKDVKDILGAILKTIAEIVLPIVVVMVIYSGFLYVMARGNSEAIEKAHKTLTWTLIGAAILLGAQLIANVLIDTVSGIGTDSGYNDKTTKTDSFQNQVKYIPSNTPPANTPPATPPITPPVTPPNTNNIVSVFSDPLDPMSILNNSRVTGKITEVTAGTGNDDGIVSYELTTTVGVDAANLYCKENKVGSNGFRGDSQSEKTITGFNAGLNKKSITTDINIQKGRNYICAFDYTDPKINDYLITNSFVLKVGAGN